jgi:hypothetical protein
MNPLALFTVTSYRYSHSVELVKASDDLAFQPYTGRRGGLPPFPDSATAYNFTLFTL